MGIPSAYGLLCEGGDYLQVILSSVFQGGSELMKLTAVSQN